VIENPKKGPSSDDTLSPADFPLNSPESRAAARLQLRKSEHVVKYYVGTDGTECEPIAATIGGGGLPELRYERREGETVNAFKRRVYRDLPAGSPLRCVRLIPREDHPPKPREPLPENWAN
jgi:hypothetical protein